MSAKDDLIEHLRDEDNLQMVCRDCHARCHSIEKRFWPDALRIAAEKRAQRGYGLDGRRGLA